MRSSLSLDLPAEVIKIIFSNLDGEIVLSLFYSNRVLHYLIKQLVQEVSPENQSSLRSAVSRRNNRIHLFKSQHPLDYQHKNKCRDEFPLAHRFIVTSCNQAREWTGNIDWTAKYKTLLQEKQYKIEQPKPVNPTTDINNPNYQQDKLRSLIASGASVELVLSYQNEIKMRDSWVLHNALQCGRVDLVEYFLELEEKPGEKKFKIDHQFSSKETLLDVAFKFGMLKPALYLMRKGAAYSNRIFPSLVERNHFIFAEYMLEFNKKPYELFQEILKCKNMNVLLFTMKRVSLLLYGNNDSTKVDQFTNIKRVHLDSFEVKREFAKSYIISELFKKIKECYFIHPQPEPKVIADILETTYQNIKEKDNYAIFAAEVVFPYAAPFYLSKKPIDNSFQEIQGCLKMITGEIAPGLFSKNVLDQIQTIQGNIANYLMRTLIQLYLPCLEVKMNQLKFWKNKPGTFQASSQLSPEQTQSVTIQLNALIVQKWILNSLHQTLQENVSLLSWFESTNTNEHFALMACELGPDIFHYLQFKEPGIANVLYQSITVYNNNAPKAGLQKSALPKQ